MIPNRAPLAAIPTLDDLARDPSLADTLPAAAVAALLGRAQITTAALHARLLSIASESHGPSPRTPADRTIGADEIAAILGVNRRFVFRHAKELPFIRRVSRKALAASETAVRRWRETQRA